MFEAKTYTERRKILREKVGSGIILFPGNDDVGMNCKDNTFHFRQDSTFLYYFGIDQPGLAGAIDENGEAILFGNELTLDHIIWMGNQPSLAERASRAGIYTVKPLSTLTGHFSGEQVHIIPPYRPEHTLKYAEWLQISPSQVEDKVSEELIKAIVSMRSYKTEEEVQEIEKAVNTTIDMHFAAMSGAKAGMKESEVVGLVHGTAISSGGNLSFPIIGSKNGQILHNHYHGNTIQEGDLFLCDSGAETTMHYAGDMTRTFPVGNSFTSKQKEIYDIVVNAHLSAMEVLKPGVLYRDVHLLAAQKIAEGLRQVGIMKGDPEEAVKEGAHALFFPHGLGHMMGLDVHDMENLGEDLVGYTPELKRSKQFGLSALRLGRALEKNFVLTVEPGIYFIPELIDVWSKEKKHASFIDYQKLESYLDFGGIRVEDDVVITHDGYRKLGKDLARTSDEVEAVRQGNLHLA